tara:strand:- start:2074 stop:2901 length:828 start_codon:yes stop_codon:yes gene_type:complete
MRIDKILMQNIEETVPDEKVALLLSGGVDSMSVGFSAHRLGKKITAYSFKTDEHDSYDYNKAQEVAEAMGWDFVGTVVPTNNLKEDFYRLLEMGCIKKTHFECVYPFLYVYPTIKEKYVLSGWAADGYYGVSKKAIINYSQTLELLNEFRDDYFKPENRAGYDWHNRLAKNYDKIFYSPYLSDNVKKFFYTKGWQEINKPKQKFHVRVAFDEFKPFDKIKNHSNLQLDSQINKVFETLLDDEEINFKNRSRIMDICRDWVKLKEFQNEHQVSFDL